MTRHNAHRSDWILLALLSAQAHRLTAVKLQKTLFLLGERRSRSVGADYYDFQPYHYGPFDAQIYHDASLMATEGLIDIDTSQGQRLRRYALTEAGERAAHAAAKRQPKAGVSYLREVVAWAQPLPFNVLVRAIYDAYPQMRVNSIFKERSEP